MDGADVNGKEVASMEDHQCARGAANRPDVIPVKMRWVKGSDDTIS